MKQIVLVLVIAFLVSACSDQKIDTTKARLEMEAREIKRVSEGEVVEKALNIGNEMTKQLSIVNNSNDGFSIKDIESTAGRVVFLTLSDLQNYDDNGKRFQVYDAQAYNIENSIESEAGVQILEGDTLLLYTRPAFYENKQIGIYSIDLSRKEIVLSIK